MTYNKYSPDKLKTSLRLQFFVLSMVNRIIYNSWSSYWFPDSQNFLLMAIRNISQKSWRTHEMDQIKVVQGSL